MKVVIDIPEELYKHIKNDNVYYLEDGEELYTIVKNGISLPKGHGDLIDRDKLELDTEWDEYYDGFISYSEMQIKNADVIVKAGKENQNEK